MRLTWEQIIAINWNDFSWQDIECLIDLGYVTEEDIAHYYNNKLWKDTL